MNRINRNVFLLFFLSLPLLLLSQNSQSILEDDFLKTVKSQNIGLKKTFQEIEKAKADYLASSSVFLPSVTASHSGLVTTNPLMAFGSRLNQGILTSNDFDPSRLNNPSATRNFATIIQVEQPIINVDGLYQRKAAKDQVEAMSLQSSRIEDYVVLESQSAYMNLQLAYKRVQVLEKALRFAFELAKQTQDFFEEGILQKSDVLLVEIRVVELQNQLQSAKSNIVNSSNYVSFLMNKKENVLLVPKDSLLPKTHDISFHENSLNRRADIKAMELTSDSRKKLLQADKMSYLPRLNAFGSYEIYDDNLFQGGANGYIVGAELTWELFKGNKRRGKILKAKAAYEQSKLDVEEYKAKSNLELSKTRRFFEDAQNNLKLSQLILQQSEEVLRIKTNRFAEGLEKVNDVLAAETDVANKRLAYYQAIHHQNHMLYHLQFLTKQN